MPARGSRAGEYWTRDHLDTADTLKFIHIQKQAGVVPDVEEFLRTPIGKQLVEKWGAGTKGAKKVKYNFRLTLGRYEEWRNSGGGAGQFDVVVAALVVFLVLTTLTLFFLQETLRLNSFLERVFLFLKVIVHDKVV